MHILLLNEYFPPDTSATAKCAAQVADALAVNHRVTVLAGRPSYDPSEHHPRYFLRREVRGNLVVERVGSTAYPRFQMRRRVSNYLTYLALAVPRALSIPSDVVLAMTDPPIEGIAGALVARLTGRPFVYNIRDMYPDMAVGGSIVRSGSFAARWEAMHRWALRRAARVIVLGEDMSDRIVAKGVDPTRVVISRDGIEIPETLPSPDNAVAKEIRGDFRFTLVHAGNVGFYGAWQTLISAVRMLENEGVGLVFIGEGAMKPQVEALAAGCRAIRFLPFRPASEVPLVLSSGDLHIVTVKRGLEGVVVPSKLYPTLAAGRPVMGIAPEESDVVRIIRRAGCGIAADPDDPEKVAEAIRTVLHNPEQLKTMGRRARDSAGSYDKVMQLKMFVETLEELFAKKAS
ncbi:MAG TPA: glycosyltransferase family 4 protein [Candidatus Sulfotelmatobacter sp.]|nr:glycosyltransferase family 4 protein [Candidatus Sulfotelmatobacter sp.]